MSTYTIPAGVDVPSDVGATIHLAVPDEWSCECRSCLYGNREHPPPVLAALAQKKCETCKGSSLDLSPESIMRTFAKRMDGAPPGSVGVDDCPACAGSGFDLLDLVRECHANHLIDSHEPLCDETGHLSVGRWKVEALLPVRTTGDVFGEWSHNGWTACVAIDYSGKTSVISGIEEWTPITVTGPPPEPGGYVATLTLVVAP